MSLSMYVLLGGATVVGILAFLVIGRLFWGPTTADRMVSLDTLNTLVVAAMVLLAAVFDAVVMVDIAIVYAALSFVGTLFLSRYLEGGE